MLPASHRFERPHKDAQVKRETRMPHVEQLEHLPITVFPRCVVALGHLPPSGNTGLHRQKLVASVTKLVRFLNRYRPGPDHR